MAKRHRANSLRSRLTAGCSVGGAAKGKSWKKHARKGRHGAEASQLSAEHFTHESQRVSRNCEATKNRLPPGGLDVPKVIPQSLLQLCLSLASHFHQQDLLLQLRRRGNDSTEQLPNFVRCQTTKDPRSAISGCRESWCKTACNKSVSIAAKVAKSSPRALPFKRVISRALCSKLTRRKILRSKDVRGKHPSTGPPETLWDDCRPTT